jgi:3',5'-cyclic AMP phosphodiesterase CpdA
MAFILAHLSDPHIGPLPRPGLRELMGKRVTGYANWLSARSRAHDMSVLGRVVADLKAHAPDHIAMTGDILNLGLSREYPLARAWLAGLGDAGHVSFVPGNHDAYAPDTLPDLARTFVPWTRGDDAMTFTQVAGEVSHYPYVRRRGRVALIGVSSAVATRPFTATGLVGAAQCEALAQVLRALRREGLARVLLIHHPPHHDGAPPIRALRDARMLEAVLAREGAELVLHGHNHTMTATQLPGPNGAKVPVVGVASASLRARGGPEARAGYRLFRIEPRGKGFEIWMRTRQVGAVDGALEDVDAASWHMLTTGGA